MSTTESVAGSESSFHNQHVYDNAWDEASTDNSYNSKGAATKQKSILKNKQVLRVDPEKNKQVKVLYYETPNIPNATIRNAVTGAPQYSFRVGTYDEYLFYSVMLATGESGQTAACLFFDNPEQYEKHFFTTIPNEAKDAWRDTRTYYNNRRKVADQK
jgi:hypothetical protein